jgi:hypothetical protein
MFPAHIYRRRNRKIVRPYRAQPSGVLCLPPTVLMEFLFYGLKGIPLKISQSLAARNRNALLITDTELKLIARLASIGLSTQPKNG